MTTRRRNPNARRAIQQGQAVQGVKKAVSVVGNTVRKAAVSGMKGYLKGTEALAEKVKKHLPEKVRAPRRSPRRPRKRM